MCWWNCRRDTLCSSSRRSASLQLTLTLGQPKSVQATFCLRRTFPLHCLRVTSRSLQTASRWALLPLPWYGAVRPARAGCCTAPAISWHYLGEIWQLSTGHIMHDMAPDDRKVLMLSQLRWGNLSRVVHPKARWHTFCILISFIGGPTIFGVVLQASEDDCRSDAHDKDTLGLHGTQRLECLSLQTALYLGDRLNTRRRLGGFSLLSTIRCQTSWISPSADERFYSLVELSHLEQAQCNVLESWRILWAFSLLATLASVADFRLFAPCVLTDNRRHYSGLTTDICRR